MTEYRTQFYEKYVSTFKGEPPSLESKAMKRYWDWCRHKYMPILRPFDRNSTLLDLGCGSGALMAFLEKEGFTNVQGIDISEEQIAIANQRNLRAEVQDARHFLASQPEQYDAIFAIDFVEHFTIDELSEIFEEIKNALKPGGKLIIQTPNGAGLFSGQVIYGDLTHQTIFTPHSIAQILRYCGLQPDAVKETGPVPASVQGSIRIVLWQIVRLAATLLRTLEAGKWQHRIWTENMIFVAKK